MTFSTKFNNWIFLYYLLFTIFPIINSVLAVQVLPKHYNRLRLGNHKIRFPNSFAHLEINGKPISASSFESMAVRRSLPRKYQLQEIKKLFDKNGVLYLPRLTKPVPYFVNDQFGKKNGNFDTPRHRYLKKLLKDNIMLEDKNKYSNRKEDIRKKENGVRMFLIKALRRNGGEKPRAEFEFSELVA